MDVKKINRYAWFLLSFCVLCILFSCSAEVNVTRCEINVKQGSTDIPCGSGYFNFGNIPLNFSQSITFTIENTGIADLNLTGTPKVEVKDQNAADFTAATNLTDSTVAAESDTTFIIHFKPTSLGSKSATVSIANDDKKRNPYTFAIVGNATPPAPEMHIKQNETDILCATGTFDFGSIIVNEFSLKIEFTIFNNGNEDLKLNGVNEKVSKSGTNADLFEIDQEDILTTIQSSNTTSFYITFKPTSAGIKTAKISILNNDSDENPYTFTITGTAIAAPEINVKQGSDNLLNGTGRYNFTDTLVNESTEVIFTIENLGTATLHVNNISISGTNASVFSEDTALTDEYTAHGNSTTFKITFAPTNTGLKSATVSITNNDYDENPYTFTIEGKGVLSEINIKQDTNNIPSGTGLFDFGYSRVNYSSLNIEFTIENLGDGNLILSDSQTIELFGAHSSEFVVNATSTLTTITPGSDTKFKLKFSPTSSGTKTATVSIKNNDSDENPYTFTITGIARNYTKGDVNGDGYTDVVVGAPFDDDGGSNSGCAFIFFGSNSMSSLNDASNANVKLIGEDIDDNFGFSVTMAGDVNNDGFEDIVVGAWNDSDGGSKSGCAFIFLGKQTWNSSYDASNADVKLVGEDAADYFGCSVSSAGDVNNDCYDDIIIGAMYDDDEVRECGCAFIFMGRQTWGSTIDASNANVKLTGEGADNFFGNCVSKAGDVNNDGFEDVIVGASYDDDGGSDSGCAFVFFGKQNWDLKINASNANVKLIGEFSRDFFGDAVSSAGDVNKDGYDDIVIGARGNDTNGDYCGCAYIFFGRQNWSSPIDASNASVKIVGNDMDDEVGYSVCSAGDINKDGFDDIIIGGIGGDDGVYRAGCVYVFYGRNVWASSLNARNCNFLIYGESYSDLFGYCVSTFCDFNKDGFLDIIVSAPGKANGGINAGSAYIFYGKSNWNPSISALNADVKIIGDDDYDYFGKKLSGH